MKEVLKWIDDHKDEMISDLEKLININSVEGEALPDAPFGQGPKDALLKFLEFGDSKIMQGILNLEKAKNRLVS